MKRFAAFWFFVAVMSMAFLAVAQDKGTCSEGARHGHGKGIVTMLEQNLK